MFDLSSDAPSLSRLVVDPPALEARRAGASKRREPLSVDDVDLVAIDTETTGLGWHERLVELGAVRVRRGEVVARWRTLINPARPIPKRVTAIHGITDAHVAEAPDARAALLELQRFCEGAVLLAHNAVFDRDILAAETVRAGLAPLDAPLYCTWRFARHAITDAPRYGLTPLAKHLSLPTESPHRALADAELTHRLFAACRARLPSPVTLATLDAHATEAGAPWRVAGAVRRVRDLSAALRPLRAAKAKGRAVTLAYRGEDGAGCVASGVPRVLYERAGEGMVDLESAPGRVITVPFASVVSLSFWG